MCAAFVVRRWRRFLLIVRFPGMEREGQWESIHSVWAHVARALLSLRVVTPFAWIDRAVIQRFAIDRLMT